MQIKKKKETLLEWEEGSTQLTVFLMLALNIGEYVGGRPSHHMGGNADWYNLL
jgi:hypothetical protein